MNINIMAFAKAKLPLLRQQLGHSIGKIITAIWNYSAVI
jgi:hypothetical protein